MSSTEAVISIAPLRSTAVDSQELEYIAFSGQYEIAHSVFRSIPREHTFKYANKFVLSQVIHGGIKKMRTFLSASAEVAAHEEKQFIDETVQLFIRQAKSTGNHSRELFESLLLWSSELTKLSLLQEAVSLYNEALTMGVNKFPDLYVCCIVGKAHVLNTMGKFSDTQSLLSSLAERPYLIPNRDLVPELLFSLGKESLLRGDVAFYKALLFRGLRHFYTSIEGRQLFVEQVRKTYRHSYKVILAREIVFSDKLLFAIHGTAFLLNGLRLARVCGLAKAATLAMLGYVYWLNYILPASPRSGSFDDGRRQHSALRVYRRRRNILITRAMGGIGDLLMMTPGMTALKKKFPDEEIHLAIPKRYFALFQGNTDVRLIDIEQNPIDHQAYRKWFNFTDCPAARIESMTAPRVKKGRAELFARGMGLGSFRLRQRLQKQPRYVLSDGEREFKKNFWREHDLEDKVVVGIQLHSDEVYRDYPHMKQLAAQLAGTYHVLVFDAEPISGYDGPGVTKVAGMPLRSAFALAAGCDAIIAPDSAFVHLAGALAIPCVALFGPIDGALRTQDYPYCKPLDARKRLGCLPCWRNDRTPCLLTNMRPSVCMSEISLDDIHAGLNEVLERKNHNGSAQ